MLDVRFGGRSVMTSDDSLPAAAPSPDVPYTLGLDGPPGEPGVLVARREGQVPGRLMTAVVWQSIDRVFRRYKRFATRWHADGVERLTSSDDGWRLA